jgi:hypothetical protein
LKFLLKDTQPLANGASRLVYRHPQDPGLLIKVMKPSWLARRFGKKHRWYKPRRRRYRHLLGHLREVREHLALHAEGQDHPPFLQKIVGFAETDLGLGLVIEAVRDRDGGLAPTLAKLIDAGKFTPEHAAALDAFCESVANTSAIFTDLTARNVVYGSTERAGERFVFIDGLGFKTLIPLQRMSGAINRWSNRRAVKKFRADVAARIKKAATALT